MLLSVICCLVSGYYHHFGSVGDDEDHDSCAIKDHDTCAIKSRHVPVLLSVVGGLASGYHDYLVLWVRL